MCLVLFSTLRRVCVPNERRGLRRAVAQLKELLGIRAPKSNDVLPNLKNFVSNLDSASWRVGAIALAAAALLFLSRRAWRGRHLPREFPTHFILLVLAMVASWGLGLRDTYAGVPMAGAMPTAFPVPAVPDFAVFGDVTSALAPALVVASIAYAQSIGVAITYAREARERLDCDQELIAMGAASVTSGFFGGFAQSASLTRSAITARMGGRTPMANAYSACCAILALLFVGPAFE